MSEALSLYTLVPFDRGARVRWTAAEIGLTVEEKHLDFQKAEHKAEAFRAISPFGVVPAVQWQGNPLWDSAGICQYLVEQHPQAGLAPATVSPMRASYLSWLFFAASSLDSAIFAVFYSSVLSPNADKREDAIARAKPSLDVLSAHVSTRQYVLGEVFSLPDVLIGHGLVLLKMSKALTDYPVLEKYRERLAARPAAQGIGLFGG